MTTQPRTPTVPPARAHLRRHAGPDRQSVSIFRRVSPTLARADVKVIRSTSARSQVPLRVAGTRGRQFTPGAGVEDADTVGRVWQHLLDAATLFPGSVSWENHIPDQRSTLYGFRAPRDRASVDSGLRQRRSKSSQLSSDSGSSWLSVCTGRGRPPPVAGPNNHDGVSKAS